MRNKAWIVFALAVWAAPLRPADTSSAIRPQLSCQADDARVSCTLQLVADASAPEMRRVDLESREVVVVRDRERGPELRGRRRAVQLLAMTAESGARFALPMRHGAAATEVRIVVRGAGSILATERWFLLADDVAGVRLTRNHPALLAAPVPTHAVEFAPPPGTP
jgi:hypothetical protein